MNDGAQIKNGKRFTKFVTAVPIDVLPGHRRHSRQQRHAFHIPPRFFEGQQTGEETGIIIDDAVGEEATAFPPELLVVFGAEAQLAEIGIGDGAA